MWGRGREGGGCSALCVWPGGGEALLLRINKHDGGHNQVDGYTNSGSVGRVIHLSSLDRLSHSTLLQLDDGNGVDGDDDIHMDVGKYSNKRIASV